MSEEKSNSQDVNVPYMEEQAINLVELSKSDKKIAFFNKASGAFIGFVSLNAKDTLNKEYVVGKEVEVNEDTQMWVGDYETGKIVDKEHMPQEVTESALDKQTQYTIRDVYDYYHQINVLMGAVRTLIDENNLSGDSVDKFKTVADFIDERKAANAAYKKAYAESPDYDLISKTEQ